MTLKKIAPFFAAMILMACGDDSSSSASSDNETDAVVESSSSSKVEDLSSSEASEEKSSSSEVKTAESSSGDAPEQSSSSESVEESSSSEILESSSSEVLPRKIANIDVRSFRYEYAGMDFVRMVVVNNEAHELDSLTFRFFFTAKPEEVEECATLIDSDICQMIDADGSGVPCKNDREIHDLLRHALPVRLDNSYDLVAETYTYYLDVFLGSTMIKPQSKLMMDFGFSSGISNDGYKTCETMRVSAKKRFSKESSDWSWMPHALEDGAVYAGMPLEKQNYGDAGEEIPLNPYIFVFRKELKDGFLWGYSPIDDLIGL